MTPDVINRHIRSISPWVDAVTTLLVLNKRSRSHSRSFVSHGLYWSHTEFCSDSWKADRKNFICWKVMRSKNARDLITMQIRSRSQRVHFPLRGGQVGQRCWISSLWACSFRRYSRAKLLHMHTHTHTHTYTDVCTERRTTKSRFGWRRDN